MCVFVCLCSRVYAEDKGGCRGNCVEMNQILTVSRYSF